MAENKKKLIFSWELASDSQLSFMENLHKTYKISRKRKIKFLVETQVRISPEFSPKNVDIGHMRFWHEISPEFSPEVSPEISLYGVPHTRTENTTFAFLSRERKWYFRPGYGEKVLHFRFTCLCRKRAFFMHVLKKAIFRWDLTWDLIRQFIFATILSEWNFR